jgi:hypothetical protein
VYKLNEFQIKDDILKLKADLDNNLELWDVDIHEYFFTDNYELSTLYAKTRNIKNLIILLNFNQLLDIIYFKTYIS